MGAWSQGMMPEVLIHAVGPQWQRGCAKKVLNYEGSNAKGPHLEKMLQQVLNREPHVESSPSQPDSQLSDPSVRSRYKCSHK